MGVRYTGSDGGPAMWEALADLERRRHPGSVVTVERVRRGDEHIHAAARALEQVLRARHPDRTFVATVRPLEP